MTLLRIGQLAKRLGVRTSALRYYEEQGLLAPAARSASGYRLYDEQAEQTLRFIQRAQRLGFSLADIHTLLKGWQHDDLSDKAIINIAEARYLALEQQVTQLLVLQHELQLFLQDMHQKAAQQQHPSTHFNQLLEHVCTDRLTQEADSVLDWLLTHTGCVLNSSEAQTLLDQLRSQHVHIWQKGTEYHILVVSHNPLIGQVLEQLTQLEAGCQAHTNPQQAPELIHNDEGYLFIARGDHAFIFARLFLALEQEK